MGLGWVKGRKEGMGVSMMDGKPNIDWPSQRQLEQSQGFGWVEMGYYPREQWLHQSLVFEHWALVLEQGHHWFE